MVAGKDAARPGEGKNSWLTGTAAWNWITITQHILGVKPAYNGLQIDPCIPSSLKSYTIKRQFRGATYTINVKNPEGLQHGNVHLTIDGKQIAGNIVPMMVGEHTVDAIISLK